MFFQTRATDETRDERRQTTTRSEVEDGTRRDGTRDGTRPAVDSTGRKDDRTDAKSSSRNGVDSFIRATIDLI